MAGIEIECVLDAGAQIGEGAVWDIEDQALWWVDIPRGHLHRYDPSSRSSRTLEMGEPVGCMALRSGGGAVAALASGFWLVDLRDGSKSKLFDPEQDNANKRFNDGTTDMRGRFWAGTMTLEGEPEPVSSFYRLDPELTCERFFTGLYVTNGCAFSPDSSRMYFSDSHRSVRTIWVCDYDLDSGTPGERRVFFETSVVAGRPDGGTVDADGCYWMAGVGGWQLVRLTPAGEIDRIIKLPVERPSKPMFGGPNLDTLFVTTISENLTPGTTQPQAGGLFAITGTGCQGVPQARFQG